MPVLSIISCKIMQDEIIWILENDSSIDEIIIVENENIKEFVEKLNKEDIQPQIIPFEKISPLIKMESRYVVLVWLMKLGLHRSPKDLKNRVYDTIKKLSPLSSGILVFYGLCGNVLGNIEKDFEAGLHSCPVRILKDKKHRIVDDCIGATVGGTDNYLKILKSVSDAGTYLFTPMYSQGWRELLDLDNRTYGKDPAKALKMLKKLHEMVGYRRVAKINTGLKYTENFDEAIREFADIFNFEILEFDYGNQKIFEDCYNELKTEIRENKND